MRFNKSMLRGMWVLWMAALLPACGQAESGLKALPEAAQEEAIVFTFIKDCTESVENDNAAFSVLKCPSIGSYGVQITAQSPQFYTVELTQGEMSLMSEFETLANDLPLEPGKAIEWHLQNGEPHMMVFRMGWGSEEEPFAMTNYLVVNLVTEKGICPLAAIDTKKNKAANDLARSTVKDLWSTSSCEGEVNWL